MIALFAFVRFEATFLVGATVLVVVYQLLTGHINTRGLLDDKLTGRQFSPERIQLLAITVGGALFYLIKVIGDPTHFPQLPRELVLAMGGSNALYLGGKAFSLFSVTRPAPEAETQNKGG